MPTTRRKLVPWLICGVVLLVFALAFRARLAQSVEPLPEAMLCPVVTAHVTIHDYAGPFEIQFCVDSSGLQYTGSNLYVSGGDPFSDGIFHNEFEASQ